MHKPVAFASRKLSPTEQRYSASERELLAIVYCYDQFYSHVYGRKIKFYTDHEPLVTMCKLKNPMGRLGRLFHRLQDVDYELIYLPGEQNFLPDFLSRVVDSDGAEAKVNIVELQSSIDWKTEQSKDAQLVQVISLVRNNAPESSWSSFSDSARWLHEKRQLYLSSGILKHSQDRIVVPRQLKEKILRLHHDSPFAGHRAFESTLLSIRSRYYWNYMPSEVKSYCQSCDVCQRFNYAYLHNRAPLKPLIVTRAWQLLGLDYMGPFKCSRHSNSYIIFGHRSSH